MTRAQDSASDTVDNAAYATARPRLSVLIPFLRDDPSPLIAALDREAGALGDLVEMILLDDGTADPSLTLKVARTLAGARLAARLLSLAGNEGRARGRNRLAAQARSHHFLFLDSDMRPDRDDFLQAWLELIARSDPPMAFGGFSLKTAPAGRAFAVHRRLSATRECLSAVERAQNPEKHVFTSNLMIRRDVFETEAFDADFTGWGWEDVEWAMRVGRRFPILHVENSATHLGLDTAEVLTGKYEQSVANFARVVARHPDRVAAYPSYRVAKLLKRAPGHALLKPLFKAIALSGLLPTAARAVSLRLYRAALYAEAV